MDRLRLLVAAALVFLAAPALAQSGKDLIGSWTLVSSTIRQGGNTIQPFGGDPKGALIFDANGRYVAMIARAGLPKIRRRQSHGWHARRIPGDREWHDRAFRQLRGRRNNHHVPH